MKNIANGVTVENREGAIEAINSIVGKTFDWCAEADADVNAEDYFTGVVTGTVTEEQGNEFAGVFVRAFLRETPENISLAVSQIFDIVRGVSGGVPITRREALIAFAAWKISGMVADIGNAPLAELLRESPHAS